MISRRAIVAALVLGVMGSGARAGSPDAPVGTMTFADPAHPPFYRALDEIQAARVSQGQSLFNTQWVATSTGAEVGRREGLGPLFNATSCATCHPAGARGAGPAGNGAAPVALEIQLETSKGTGVDAGDPIYGHVFNTSALDGVSAEGAVTIRYTELYGYYYPDGIRWHIRVPHYQLRSLTRGPLAPTTVIKPRLAPALFGVGLLEAVPASAIGTGGVGRFGWQEEAISVRDQTTRAFAREMGVTSADRPDGDCTSAETDCMARTRSAGAQPAVSEELVEALVTFEHELAIPASAAHPKNATLGSQLFALIGCGDCHRPRLPVEITGEDGTRVTGVIAPYTDLRLHDLGMEMADENVSGAKVASRWRTAPLWGFGYRLRTESQPTFLHDGRARTAEEAVLWHSGEAARARREFTNLGPRSRAALLHWLETL